MKLIMKQDNLPISLITLVPVVGCKWRLWFLWSLPPIETPYVMGSGRVRFQALQANNPKKTQGYDKGVIIMIKTPCRMMVGKCLDASIRQL